MRRNWRHHKNTLAGSSRHHVAYLKARGDSENICCPSPLAAATMFANGFGQRTTLVVETRSDQDQEYSPAASRDKRSSLGDDKAGATSQVLSSVRLLALPPPVVHLAQRLPSRRLDDRRDHARSGGDSNANNHPQL